VATAGDGVVKVHELSDFKDVYAILNLEEERGALESLDWTDDGAFLSVSTRSGNIYTFLTKLPVIGAARGAIAAYVTGLKEITITSQTKDLAAPFAYKKNVDYEPNVLAVGPNHWAIALNQHVTYLHGGWPQLQNIAVNGWGRFGNGFVAAPPVSAALSGTIKGKLVKPGDVVMEKDYANAVSSITMNTTHVGVVLTDGRLQIHTLELERGKRTVPDKEVMTKGGPNQGLKITCAALTNDLLIYATNEGVIHHYSLEDWTLVSEMKHQVILM
jgi:WD repeat-containing protein 19